MKKLIVVILVLIASQSAFAQSGWVIIANSVTSNDLKDVDFTNPETGWVTGGAGTLLKTINGGVNWETQLYSNSPTLYGYQISVLNSETLFISSYYQLTPQYWGNKILRSDNGGISWNEIYSSYYIYYYPFYFLNSSTGWLCINSVLRSTINGGINWSNNSTINSQYSVNNVQFLNTNVGWVISDSAGGVGKILSTTDGGNSWNSKTMPERFNNFYFINASTGFLYSTKIFRTTNNGLNWQEKLSGNNFYKIKFINDLTGYCVTDGYIYKTTNTGENWFTDYHNSSYSFKSIDFANENTGWVVGNTGLIMKTTTGGTVFVSQISSEIPEQFLLKQNYPNPFNPSTKINYEIKSAGFVSLKVFDLLGKEVAQLVNEKQNAGSYAVDFNSTEFNLPSGIYFYTLNSGEFKETRKMVLVN